MIEPDKTIYTKILMFLKQHHPSPKILRPSELEIDFEDLNINAMYLEAHGLAEFRGTVESRDPIAVIQMIGGDVETKISGQITTSGLDYLTSDGGLTEELSTVTIRLHADTIRDLIETRIVASDQVAQEDKPRLIAALRGMREEGLKQLTTRLVTYGLDQGAMTSQQLWQLMTS